MAGKRGQSTRHYADAAAKAKSDVLRLWSAGAGEIRPGYCPLCACAVTRLSRAHTDGRCDECARMLVVSA